MRYPKEFYLNRAQLCRAVANAKIQVDIDSRGTGKSTGIGWKSKEVARVMPRGRFAFLSPSYQRLLTRTLPPVIKQWENLGLYRDHHYVIGVQPPKAWKTDGPYLRPLDYKHFVSFSNGSGYDLVSQDRTGDSRGPDWDYLIGDEGLTLNYFKLQTESFATLRGNRGKFDTPLHHGITIASTQPYDAAGNWIHEFGNYYLENGHDYSYLNEKRVKLLLQFIDSNNITEQRQLWREIYDLKQQIRYYRHKYILKNKEISIYYSEADIFDNIRNIGFEYIKTQRRIMSDYMFKVEILNARTGKVEDGFYANLTEDNKYIKYDYDYLDSLDFNFDAISSSGSSGDGDVDRNAPIDVAVDPGAHINFLVAGQLHNIVPRPEYRFIKDFFVKSPELIHDVVDKFCDYYASHRNKLVKYYYDVTSTGHDGKSKLTYAEEVVLQFQKRGWEVEQIYIGPVPNPQERHLMWAVACKGHDPRLPLVRVNRDNCKQLLISMEQTAVKQKEGRFEKEKKAEKNLSFPQEDAPHGSDAADTLFFGQFATDMGSKTNALGMLWSS